MARSYYDIINEIAFHDDGLPKYYYRTDLLPDSIVGYDAEKLQQVLYKAVCPLHRGEYDAILTSSGYFWDELEAESSSNYRLFNRYVQFIFDFSPIRDEAGGALVPAGEEALGQSRDIILADGSFGTQGNNLRLFWTRQLREEMSYDELFAISSKFYWGLRFKCFQHYRSVFQREKTDIRVTELTYDSLEMIELASRKAREYFGRDWVAHCDHPMEIARVMEMLAKNSSRLANVRNQLQSGDSKTDKSVSVVVNNNNASVNLDSKLENALDSDEGLHGEVLRSVVGDRFTDNALADGGDDAGGNDGPPPLPPPGG